MQRSSSQMALPRGTSSDALPAPAGGEDSDKTRFQIELEFVQCLANPNYLNFLAQRGYLRDKSFINYLEYLKYWKKPEYIQFIKYPNCLYLLDLLQHEAFRRELTNPQCARFIDDQLVLFWQHYTRQKNNMMQMATQPPSEPAKPAESQ